jgi:hypothetical protein
LALRTRRATRAYSVLARINAGTAYTYLSGRAGLRFTARVHTTPVCFADFTCGASRAAAGRNASPIGAYRSGIASDIFTGINANARLAQLTEWANHAGTGIDALPPATR